MSAIAAVLPATTVKVADLPEAASLPEPQRNVYDQLGIDTVGVDDGRTAADLAADAASRVLVRAGADPEDVDVVVSIQSRVPEKLMASEATRLQHAIGAHRAMSLAVTDLGCVSISSALLVGRGLLLSDPDVERVLVAHGSKPPGPRRYRHPVTVSGDGGLALLLTRAGPNRIRDLSLETNGEYWDLYSVDYRDHPSDEWSEECSSLKTYSFKLAIESRNRFVKMVDDALARSGIEKSAVDHWIMQNISAGAFRFYEELFGITFARACWENLRQYGHLGSIDVALNLDSARAAGEIRDGQIVMVLNNSPVAAWSTMLVEA